MIILHIDRRRKGKSAVLSSLIFTLCPLAQPGSRQRDPQPLNMCSSWRRCCTFMKATRQKIYGETAVIYCAFLSASPQFYLWQYDAHFDINISRHIYYSDCQRCNLIGSLYHPVQTFASADFHMNVVQYWLLLLWYSSGVRNLWDISIFTRVHTLSCSCFLISDVLIVVKCAIMTQIVYQKAGYTSYLHHITKRGLELEADESSAAAYLFLEFVTVHASYLHTEGLSW